MRIHKLTCKISHTIIYKIVSAPHVMDNNAECGGVTAKSDLGARTNCVSNCCQRSYGAGAISCLQLQLVGSANPSPLRLLWGYANKIILRTTQEHVSGMKAFKHPTDVAKLPLGVRAPWTNIKSKKHIPLLETHQIRAQPTKSAIIIFSK